MKNNLTIDLKNVFISVLNIPDDYPLVTIFYKNAGILNLKKSFIVRDITFDTLKSNKHTRGRCIISFMENITKTTVFIPSQLIEDDSILDRFLGYISLLLRYNNKNSPNDIVDLDRYKLKKCNILSDMLNLKVGESVTCEISSEHVFGSDSSYIVKAIDDDYIIFKHED